MHPRRLLQLILLLFHLIYYLPKLFIGTYLVLLAGVLGFGISFLTRLYQFAHAAGPECYSAWLTSDDEQVQLQQQLQQTGGLDFAGPECRVVGGATPPARLAWHLTVVGATALPVMSLPILVVALWRAGRVAVGLVKREGRAIAVLGLWACLVVVGWVVLFQGGNLIIVTLSFVQSLAEGVGEGGNGMETAGVVEGEGHLEL